MMIHVSNIHKLICTIKTEGMQTRGPRKIKFVPDYFCAMYLENIMLPLVTLVPLLYILYLLPESL